MKISDQCCRQWGAAFALVVCASVTNAAFAQSYPSKPIRLIVPAAPGGGSDFVARMVGEKLSATSDSLWLWTIRPARGRKHRRGSGGQAHHLTAIR
jgi:hypothetical protein